MMIPVVLDKNAANLETSAGINMEEIAKKVISLPEVFLNTNPNNTMGKEPDLPPLFKGKELNEIVDAIRHYYRKMSPRMDYAEKKSLFREMQEYMVAHGIESDTMTKAVPGLKPYWQKDVLSKYEFAMIADCLAYDVFEDDQGEDDQ
jgi:hypothetical protein